jgi:hypothetical protein
MRPLSKSVEKKRPGAVTGFVVSVPSLRVDFYFLFSFLTGLIYWIDIAEKDPPFESELKPRFDLSRIVGTPGARKALIQVGQDPLALIFRYVMGD